VCIAKFKYFALEVGLHCEAISHKVSNGEIFQLVEDVMAMNQSCIFCKIIAGEIAARVLFRSDAYIVIADHAPKAELHWLVIPLVHVCDMRDHLATKELLGGMMAVAAQVVREHAQDRPFKLVMNNGHEAGQRVFHLHAHILIGHLHAASLV